MMGRSILAVLLLISLTSRAQPAIEWQVNLGGSLDDNGTSIVQTSDGGYILCGTTYSNNGDVAGYMGDGDIWVVKLDASGSIQWQRCLGGSLADIGRSIQPLPNGEYLVLGSTRSNDNDVSGNHGMVDIWLARLSASGDPIWQRCYGGSLNDVPFAIRGTPDGGYVIAGETRSSDGDVTYNAGFSDYWVLKIDMNGDIQWQRTYGGSGGETAYAIELTSDGGYILNGFSDSNDGDVSGAHGSGDYWVVKLDASGNIEWQRPCGSTNIDYGFSVIERPDGSFTAFGNAGSNGGDITEPYGGGDIWVAHLSADGQLLDERSYGGSETDRGGGIRPINSNGILMYGASQSADGDVSMNMGSFDGWVFRTDIEGEIQWSLVFGGSQSDGLGTCISTADDGYLLIGSSSSSDGNLPGNNGESDIWVLKLGPDPVGIIEQTDQATFNVFPNPFRDLLTINSRGVDLPIEWRMVDQAGKIVSNGMLQQLDQLSGENLAPGSYTLMLVGGGERRSAVIIKE